MSSNRWRRFGEVFEQALEEPVAARGAFLDRACAGDETLRLAVESLIAADARAAGFLEQPVAEPPRHASQSSEAATSEAPGECGAVPQRVGPYRLLRQVGRGGMSTIHLAERDDASFDRQVVVKLLRPDMQGEGIQRRLRIERQILASLDHPNIARMFDGGATDSGQPYFVLEYIEGLPIDTYCDQQKLSVPERLALFAKVCDAVHYAHQKLIVHRDLKPSNILVTQEGEPKLLDFGIAKLLDPDLASRDAEPTAAWVRLLTPNYASPEQVRGELITTASDVYALGVLLYELLTGDLPYRFPDPSPQEIERILAESEPLRPSAAVARLTEGAATRSSPGTGATGASTATTLSATEARPPNESRSDELASGAEPAPARATATAADTARSIEAISHQRGTAPQDLRRTLSGDLDAIVLKALRSDPRHRYGSVEQLAADLQRFAQHRPVLARRGSWRYRSVKFLRRNQRAVSAAALVTALVIGFWVALVAQSVRVARERDLARDERDEKDSVVQLVMDLFTSGDPFETGMAPDLTLREALARSEQLFAQRLESRPALRALMLHTTGVVYARIGLLEEAKSRLTEALALRRAQLGDRHFDVVESQRALADAHKALDEYPAAHALASEALATARTLVPDGDPRLLPFLNSRVSVYCYEGDLVAAEPPAAEALALAQRRAEQVAPEALTTAIEHQATLATGAGRHREAADLYRQSLDVRQRTYGPEHPFLAATLNNLGSALRRQGDLDGAREAFERTLELKRSLLGASHPAQAATLNNLARVYLDVGSPARAEALYSQSLELQRATVGDEHPRVLLLESSVALARIRQGKLDGVEEALRQGLHRWRESLGEEHRIIGSVEGVLGEALAAHGRTREAEVLLLRSLATLRNSGKQHHVRDAVSRLATFYETLGDTERAAEHAQMLTDLTD